MKYKIFLVIFIGTIIFQSCKDDAPVETPGSNPQNPSAPVLLSPSNESTVQSLTPTLDWEDFPSATSYRLQVSLDANFAGTIVLDTSGLSVSNHSIRQGILTTNVYYYWRVNASTPSGISGWSSIWRFNVVTSPPPPPVLLLPPNGSTNQSFMPLLDWQDAPTAQFYRVQVSQSPNFNQNLFDSNRIPLSQVQVPELILITNTQYFWRVNASNSGGLSTSQWSSVWNFTTLAGPTPNSISGLIRFVDTNITHSNGFYMAGAFQSWMPGTLPSENDTLEIVNIGNVYQAEYKIRRLRNGVYHIAVVFEDPDYSVVYIMGIYGCDTVHVNYSQCPNNPDTVIITNNWGRENINFLSWADTSKRIF
jgi:hypothetical protein